MQQVQRGLMPGQIQTPLMQHSHVSHGDSIMSSAPRSMMFATQPMQDATVMMDQQTRLIQQREGKAASQRALGVASNGPSIQHHPGLHQVRPVLIPTGQTIFIDAHGRQVQPPPGMAWQGIQQRGPPGAALIQVQEQHYAQHPGNQPQMLQAHYAHQLAHQQQVVAARHGSQPPSVRPPTSVSPAMLHVPAPLQRSNSHTGSMRSVSPLASQPQLQSAQWSNALQQSQQGAQAANQSQIPPNQGAQEEISATEIVAAPSTNAEAAKNVADILSVAVAVSPVDTRREVSTSSIVSKEKRRMDAISRMRRHADLVESQLTTARNNMEEARSCVEAKVKEWKQESDDNRRRFDELVLEYLEKAGYTDTSRSMRSESKMTPASAIPSRSSSTESEKGDDDKSTSSEDTTLVSEMMDGHREEQSDSPRHNQPADAPLQSDPIHPEINGKKEAMSPISKEGDSSSGSSSPQLSDVQMANGEGQKREDVEKQESLEELGYLYHWWRIFRDTQQLANLGVLNTNKLDDLRAASKSISKDHSIVKIDNSSPEAPLSSNNDTAGDNVTPVKQQSATVDQAPPLSTSTPIVKARETPSTGINATPQQFEMLRRLQQAQVRSQQQEQAELAALGLNEVVGSQQQTVSMDRRPSQVGGADMQKAVVQLPDGRNVLMSRAEVERYSAQTQHILHQNLMQDAQRRGLQAYGPVILQHPQPLPANGTIHPAMETRMVTPLQHHYAGMEQQASPAEGGAMKRQGPSPVDGPSKRAKTAGKRPTPEDHQRQALDAAARAQAMSAPQYLQTQRAANQPIARTGSAIQHSRQLTDQQRLYAQRQAEYARQQVANSPLLQVGMSPSALMAPLSHPSQGGSPSAMRSYEVGTNGLMDHITHPSGQGPTPPTTSRGRLKKTPSLSLDLDAEIPGDGPPTTGSAKRRGAAAKRGGKAPGSGRGGRKGAKGRQSVDTSADNETNALFSFTAQTPQNPNEDLPQPAHPIPGPSQSPFHGLSLGHAGQGPSSSHSQDAGDQSWSGQKPTSQGQQPTPAKHDASDDGVLGTLSVQPDGGQPANGDHIISQFENNPFNSGAFAIDDEFFKSLGSFAETEGLSFAQAAEDGAPIATAQELPPLSASASLNFDFSEGAFGDFDFTNFASQGNEHDTWG